MGRFQARHPASRGSFCLLLDKGVEKEALPELCQAFEVATARISVLVILVFSRQTGFLSASICFFITLWSYLSALY